MQGDAGSSPAGMEENGFIEPLEEDEDVPEVEATREVTSDYDPTDEETAFGSVTSSVGGHVWEYGRCVSTPFYSTLLYSPLAPSGLPSNAERYPGATMPSGTGDIRYQTTKRNTRESRCGTPCSRTSWAARCTWHPSGTTPRRSSTWVPGSASGPSKVCPPDTRH